jgi:hypothetical protein
MPLFTQGVTSKRGVLKSCGWRTEKLGNSAIRNDVQFRSKLQRHAMNGSERSLVHTALVTVFLGGTARRDRCRVVLQSAEPKRHKGTKAHCFALPAPVAQSKSKQHQATSLYRPRVCRILSRLPQQDASPQTKQAEGTL